VHGKYTPDRSKAKGNESQEDFLEEVILLLVFEEM
jgi:hypothetical protein